MPNRDYEESAIQQGIVAHFHKYYEGIIAAIPNGGWRGTHEATRLKAEGVLAGFADLIVLAPNGFCGFIEVKRPKQSYLSEAQREFEATVTAYGFQHAIARSVRDAADAFERWQIPVKQPRVRSQAEMETGL